MTLIVAANAQDHLIVAGDHCAVLSGMSNHGPPALVIRNYQKVYPWKYGAIAASGDVFLMASFFRLLRMHENSEQPIDLLHFGRLAKAARSRQGVPSEQSTGDLYFTLPGATGFQLYGLEIGRDTIDLEVIEPISTRFSMRKEAALDESTYHAFNSQLRPSFFFPSLDAFHRYHIDLMSMLYATQSASDALVTASFDLFFLDKRTGESTFWQTPATTRLALK